MLNHPANKAPQNEPLRQTTAMVDEDRPERSEKSLFSRISETFAPPVELEPEMVLSQQVKNLQIRQANQLRQSVNDLFVFDTAKVAAKHSLRLNCPKCDYDIDLKIPWVCGYCQNRHSKDTDNTIFLGCNHCKETPNAIECLSCLNHIKLNARNYAKQSLEPPHHGVGRFVGSHRPQKPSTPVDVTIDEAGDLQSVFKGRGLGE